MVKSAWEDSLSRIRRAQTILLGIPSDTGSGTIRGANLGPIGIRTAYLAAHPFPKDVLDVGDIIVVPHLLHDEMVSDFQKNSTREALYPGISESLPVAPLSIAEDAVKTLLELNPKAKLVVMGGDHSVSWPVLNALIRQYGSELGLLHFDAHPDLMEQRLGVRYCYTTWAYHVMKCLRQKHLVQVGIRRTSKTKEYWTESYPILQYWASEIKGREEVIIQEILLHFKSIGVTHLYISNDIDGTDPEEAPGTGLPEPAGLSGKFVLTLIREAKKNFNFIGGDIVEVAPLLAGTSDFARNKTCQLAAKYLDALLE